MTSIRDERAAALIRRHRDLSDDFTRALPGLLDDLEAIDREHGQAQPIVLNVSGDLTEEEVAKLRADFDEAVRSQPVRLLPPEPRTPTDAELAAWIEAHPKEFADWAARQAKAAPARTTTRRRTAK